MRWNFFIFILSLTAVSHTCLLVQSGTAQMITAFPYEMSLEHKSKFIASLQTLKIGYAYDDVKSLLGPPHEDRPLRAKGGPIRGIVMSYYLKKAYAIGGNEKIDEFVLLCFDNQKKLVSGTTNGVGLSLPVDLTDSWPEKP